jgi:hypothetical protein
VVYLGGLTDGLLACPYVEALGEVCHQRGWALVQPVLSSSYAGYGTGSLDRDTDEVCDQERCFMSRQASYTAVGFSCRRKKTV